MEYPLEQVAGKAVVTVITPTLNAAAYIEATLRSVALEREYVLEHLIIDGGSEDETAAIVTRFPHARLVDLPGSRQSGAMNYGASIAHGTFLVFLNADDVLVPGALGALLSAFTRTSDLDVAYGRAHHIDTAGSIIEPYPTQHFDASALLEHCFICQAATMIRRTSFERAGAFSNSLDFAMDYDLWLRMLPWARFTYVESVVGGARLHRSAKSVAQRSAIFREVLDVLLKRAGYVPYSWLYAFADYRLQGDDQVFEPRRPSRLKVLYALVLGLWVNRRQPIRAFRDWLAHRHSHLL